jgi:hypothetical protein
LVEKPGGKRQLGRRRCRQEDNIKMFLREMRWGMDWLRIGTGYCVSGNELPGSIKCGEFLD